MKLEAAVMNVRTVVVIIIAMASVIVGGTSALTLAAANISGNAEDIKENTVAIKKIEIDATAALAEVKAGQIAAVADVKRGLDDTKEKIDAVSVKFDLLLQELRIRNVVTETPE